MQPNIKTALKQEAEGYRNHARGLLDAAQKIEALIETLDLLEKSGVHPSPANTPTASEQPRQRAAGVVTQTEAVQQALASLGRPATLADIMGEIQSLALPVKMSSADNLRSTMSRSGLFKSNGNGVWSVTSSDSASATESISQNGSDNGSDEHEPGTQPLW